MRLIDIVKKLEGKSREDARHLCLKLFAPFHIIEEVYASGVNLVMRKHGTSGKHVVLAAHYDTFPGCSGANDDFSAIAVLHGIAQALWKKKLKHGVTLCIFDEEERGCKGSSAYVEQHGVHDVKAVIDLELVGNGDVVGLWPVTRGTPLMRTITKVLNKRKQQYEIGGELPMFYADYVPFREAGTDSICMSLIPQKEVELIRPFVTQNRYWVGFKVATGMMKMPLFFKNYHTSHDTSDKLSEKSLQRAQEIALAIVKELQK